MEEPLVDKAKLLLKEIQEKLGILEASPKIFAKELPLLKFLKTEAEKYDSYKDFSFILNEALPFFLSYLEAILYRLDFYEGSRSHPRERQVLLSLIEPIKDLLKPEEKNIHVSKLITEPPAFFQEQAMLNKDPAFRNFLCSIAPTIAEEFGLTPKTAVVSYPWEIDELPHEKWTGNYVDIWVRHLALAGLMVYQDKIHSGLGMQLNKFMDEKVASVQCVYIVVTETYLLKFRGDGTTGVATEYLGAISRWRRTGEDRLICPILLTKKGVDKLHFANAFSGVPVYDRSYLDSMKEIIMKTYFGEGGVRFGEWWDERCPQYAPSVSPVVTPLPAVESAAPARPADSPPSRAYFDQQAPRHSVRGMNAKGNISVGYKSDKSADFADFTSERDITFVFEDAPRPH